MRRLITLICLNGFLIVAMGVQAFASQTALSEARARLDAGEYGAAHDAALALIAQSEDTDTLTQAYILASEALSAQIILGLMDKPHKRAKTALKYADEARAISPNARGVHVQYALAYGLMTRTSSPLTAWRKGYASTSQNIIQELQAAYPDLAYGDGLLGAWHLGIVQKAGAKNAQKWYGATLAEGQRYYEIALSKAPGDIIISSNYAVALLVTDPDVNTGFVKDLLTAITGAQARTGLERDIQQHMASILAQFDDLSAAKELAKAFLDSRAEPISR